MSLTNAPEFVPPNPPGKPRVHSVDEVPPAPRLFVLGLQHLFIMYAGAVAVLVGSLLGRSSPHRSPACVWGVKAATRP